MRSKYSYIYPNEPMTPAVAAAYIADGFEIALHVNTNCLDWTPTSLQTFYTSQLSAFTAAFPLLPAPTTDRTHCFAWSDYATQPQTDLSTGMRLDATYYYYPGSWVLDRPGFFTGTGMPMRFVDATGGYIDVYQATTQLNDESQQTFPFEANSLLDKAIGAEGYYGAFTALMHTDFNDVTTQGNTHGGVECYRGLSAGARCADRLCATDAGLVGRP